MLIGNNKSTARSKTKKMERADFTPTQFNNMQSTRQNDFSLRNAKNQILITTFSYKFKSINGAL